MKRRNAFTVSLVASLVPVVVQVLWTLLRAPIDEAEAADRDFVRELLTNNSAVTESLPQRTRSEPPMPDVQSFNEESGCKLESRSLKFISNGMTGHTFAADMVCPHRKRRKVVLKVMTRPLNMTDRRGLYKYAPYAGREVRNYSKLNRAAMGDATTEEESERILKNLILPIGHVTFPRSMLFDEMDAINRGNLTRGYRGMANATDPREREEPLLGAIYPFTSGVQLEGNRSLWRGLSMEHKQSIVRDLVYQWRFMYEHGFLQCELLEHIYYSESERQTSVIDFQSHKVIPKGWPREKQDEFRQKQLFQILSIIGNICTTPPDAKNLALWKKPFTVPDAICHYNERDLRLPDAAFVQRVVNSTGEWCKFNDRLPWNSQTDTNDTAQMYQVLSDWSGLQEGPVERYSYGVETKAT